MQTTAVSAHCLLANGLNVLRSMAPGGRSPLQRRAARTMARIIRARLMERRGKRSRAPSQNKRHD
eukprot:15436205-Alexandrium_andersonii.AAC.1